LTAAGNDSGQRFASLTGLIAPQSLAVIGASEDAARIGGRPIAYSLSQKFHGPIYPVNPNRATVQGLPAFASLADVPGPVDAAVIAVPATGVEEAIAACAAKGVKAVVLFTAGFAEVSAEGAAHQARVVAACRAAGMRLLGPNSLGLFNARVGFYASFTSSVENGFPPPGRVGIASQSGAYGAHLFALSRARRVGTPIVVTTGNEADVTVGDVIGWLAEDAETDVIMAYLEGIRESASLLQGLATARKNRKPVVAMKVGRSVLGAAAAQSHTASLTGDDAVTEAVLRDFGVHRARTTEELVDIAYLAQKRVFPVRNTLGVITVSGGAGVLVSDAAETLGLALPPMPEATQLRLKQRLPFASPVNPVDVTAQVINDPALVGEFAEAMYAEGGYGSILAFFTQLGASAKLGPAIRDALVPVVQQNPERLFVMSILAPEASVQDYEDRGIAVMEDPSRATVAIHAMGRFGDAFAAPPPSAPPVVPLVTLPAATPDEHEAKRLLAEIGIDAAPEALCASANEAVAFAERAGFPVVLKLASPDIAHKSEIGGVILGLHDAAAVRAAHATLLERAARNAPGARITGVLAARQLSGVECIIGIAQDLVFGPVALVGLGGIFTEIFHDVAHRLCPFGAAEAEALIRSLRGFPLLDGTRGRPKANVAALATALARLSVFAHQAGPLLRAVDINPIIVTADGAFAADAVLSLETS
jgi:acyl-CoA synthetase (NDP forming)